MSRQRLQAGNQKKIQDLHAIIRLKDNDSSASRRFSDIFRMLYRHDFPIGKSQTERPEWLGLNHFLEAFTGHCLLSRNIADYPFKWTARRRIALLRNSSGLV